MASYQELHELTHDRTLRDRVGVAAVVAAETVRNELDTVPNHVNRLLWAKQVFENPGGWGLNMLVAVLAANKDVTVANITGATDAQIQAKVDDAVDVFADGS